MRTQNIDYLLIDASGSMGDKASLVIRAANDYATALTREFVRSHLTVATFADAWGMEYTELAGPLNAAHWKPIRELKCGGQTPLNDSIWTAVERIREQIGQLETQEQETSVCLAIISDGGENSSTHDLESTKELIQSCRKAGWQILFLGLDFSAEQIARDYGCESATALNTTARHLSGVFKTIASRRADATQKLLFSDSDKRNLGGR